MGESRAGVARGPLAKSAGHDINYIALSGALYACGTLESGPIPPLNLVGDFGGGGLLLALGMVSALFEMRTSGRGQVVDAAMVEGAGMLMSMIYGLRATGGWPARRAGNILDGSAYYYRCYRCACGGWMAVGAIEPEFRRIFLEKLGLERRHPVNSEAQRIRMRPRTQGSQRSSRPMTGSTGSRYSRRATRASRRCSSWKRSPTIRKMSPPTAFRFWTGRYIPCPCRASAGPRCLLRRLGRVIR